MLLSFYVNQDLFSCLTDTPGLSHSLWILGTYLSFVTWRLGLSQRDREGWAILLLFSHGWIWCSKGFSNLPKFTQDRTSHGNVKASRACRDGGAKSVTLFRSLEELTLPLEFYSQLRWKEWDISFIFQSHSLHHVGGGCWLAPWVSTGSDSPLRGMEPFSACFWPPRVTFGGCRGAGGTSAFTWGRCCGAEMIKFAPAFRAQWGIRSCQAGVPSFPPGASASFQPRCPSNLLQWDWLLVSPFSYVALNERMDRKLVQIFGGSKDIYGEEGYKQLEGYRAQVLRNSLQK